MKYRSFLPILMILCLMDLTSCATSHLSQGIRGRVRWIEGNQMPMVSENGNPKVIRPQGVARNLLIFPLIHSNEVILNEGLIILKGQIPLDSIWSNRNGKFKVRLAEGKYSLLTQEENGLFSNFSDGQGFLSPVLVSKKKWEIFDILINYKATY